MEWYNVLLNIQFLEGSYIDIIKELSFICAIGTAIGILIALIIAALEEGSIIRDILIIPATIYLILYLIVFLLLILSIVVYPAQYFAAILKERIISNYSLYFMSTFQHLCVNFIVSFISCFMYFGCLNKIITHAIKNNVEEIDNE